MLTITHEQEVQVTDTFKVELIRAITNHPDLADEVKLQVIEFVSSF